MHSFMKVWLHGQKALHDKYMLHELQKRHDNLSQEINKAIIRLKSQGHVMGCDLRNKQFTEIHVPNPVRVHDKTAKDYHDIVQLKTIRLDHKITAGLIKEKQSNLDKIIKDSDHIDNVFAKLAHGCREFIHISRVLRSVEMHKGQILRSIIFSIKHDDKRIEYY